MTFERDPVSEWLDEPAQRFLRAAYADRGNWVTGYLPEPHPRTRRAAAALGIDLDAPDKWHEPNRWVRAYKRAVYRQHQYHGFARSFDVTRRRTAPGYAVPLVWETVGKVLRPGQSLTQWEIRICLMPGGKEARRAVAAKPSDERFTDNPMRSYELRETEDKTPDGRRRRRWRS